MGRRRKRRSEKFRRTFPIQRFAESIKLLTLALRLLLSPFDLFAL
jgi:hypothetical protein